MLLFYFGLDFLFCLVIKVNLLDGSVLEIKSGSSGLDLIKLLNSSDLQKRAIAIFIDDVLSDMSDCFTDDCSVKIVTTEDFEGLEVLRHDAAHILAQAVKEIFPNTCLAIGPTIKDGFYYDFDIEHKISDTDLPIIEKKMKEIVNRKLPIERSYLSKAEALQFFQQENEIYKIEIINSIPEEDRISVYKQGDFVDLCRGPHAPNTSYLRHFKLTKVSGAYWKGDSKNKQLQRIYGTAWPTKEELLNYLERIKEAEKRDHRKIGKELSLFHIADNNPGMIFWHPKGFLIFKTLEDYIRSKILKNGYTEVRTPIVADISLWEKSGHYEMFSENMFMFSDKKRSFVLKPMNCPLHVEIYKQKLYSYRDLPLRISEFGCCHRNESSGSLHGLMRVRSFIQDDAHIFCTEEQMESETINFCNILFEVYKELGFTDIKVMLSDRPLERLGSDDIWNKSENALKAALTKMNIDFSINKGEGAFYGPKIEFILVDSLSREWQCGTLQLDFVLPERLGAKYVDNNNKHITPVMIHRAILGTLERFIGILIEHCAGKFPFWLSPNQIAIISVVKNEEILKYIEKISKNLEFLGVRYQKFIENETFNYKLRSCILERFNFIWIIGKNEVMESTVTERDLLSNKSVKKELKNAIEDIRILLNKQGNEQ
ncbi:threonine--tRNA ligase [Anaplasmataceae bacterium AB001_6]|nr:threonine--tRNA ligase [Anaplasmataceae bacterium AB001_6]